MFHQVKKLVNDAFIIRLSLFFIEPGHKLQKCGLVTVVSPPGGAVRIVIIPKLVV